MIRFRVLSLVVLPLLLLSPRLSWAQVESDDHEADERFRLGVQAQKQGHPDEARLHFLESYAVDPQPHTLFNLAAAEAQCNRPLDALRHIRQWLGTGKITPSDRSRANKIIADMFAKTGHVAVHTASSDAITIDGSDAAALVQDKGVFDVLPGHHVVETRGAMTHRTEVDVPMGATVDVRVEDPVTPVAAAPLPAPAPARPLAVEPLPQTAPSPEASHSHARLWLTVGLGAGAVALFAGGAIFGANSSSAANTVDRLSGSIPSGGCRSASSDCTTLANSVSTSNTDHTVSTVLYVTSGAALAGAALTWILWPKSTHAEAHVEPVVGAGIVGAQWVRTF